MKKLKLSFVTLSITLSACAIAPSSLQTATENMCVVIAENSSWEEPRGMVGLVWEEGVTSGVYKAKFKNDDGVFFEGAGRSVWQRAYRPDVEADQKNIATIKVGGIWVPNDRKEKPRIYNYFEAAPQTTKDINNYTNTVTVNSVSQGAAIGPTAVGSAIGGAIVNSMIQADVGKIMFFPEINDQKLIEILRSVRQCPDI